MHLRTLEIAGFRAFEKLTLTDLASVNLFVGVNNSGKTSVLEAVEMLGSPRNSSLLWTGVRRRGEASIGEDDVWRQRRAGRAEVALDVRHLFHGHDLHAGSAELTAQLTDGSVETLILRTESREEVSSREDEQLSLFERARSPRYRRRIHEHLLLLERTEFNKGTGEQDRDTSMLVSAFPLSASGALFADADDLIPNDFESGALPAVTFVPTSGWTGQELLAQWNQIVGTKTEERVLAVMKLVEPRLAQVTVLSPPRYFYDPQGSAGSFVRLEGDDDRIPLGSMGDGLRRLLVLGVALARAAGGALLVDEIDTGLHHTALAGLWRFVRESARLLNVQVFATTHSLDCVRALGASVRDEGDDEASVSVQRIETRPSVRAVAYSPSELVAAAEQGIEVRGIRS